MLYIWSVTTRERCVWIYDVYTRERREVSAIFPPKKICYYRSKRPYISSWWYSKLQCDRVIVSCEYFYFPYLYRTTRESKIFSSSSLLIGTFTIDMKGAISGRNLWSNTLEKLYNFLIRSIDKGSFRDMSTWRSEIIGLCLSIPSYGCQIALVCSL